MQHLTQQWCWCHHSNDNASVAVASGKWRAVKIKTAKVLMQYHSNINSPPLNWDFMWLNADAVCKCLYCVLQQMRQVMCYLFRTEDLLLQNSGVVIIFIWIATNDRLIYTFFQHLTFIRDQRESKMRLWTRSYLEISTH